MTYRITAIIAALSLSACGPAVTTATSEPDAVARAETGQVVLVATAPDGTKLWAVKPDHGRTVYFASTGAQTKHGESCGKNCTRIIGDGVPTGN